MIYESIYDMQNLQEAWQRVRANKTAPGIDRVSCPDFEKNLAFNLQSLQRQLQNETYKPLPVVVFHEKKAGKGHRVIGISTVRDKVVQQAVVKALIPFCEERFLPCAFAYRPKKSALSAVQKAGRLIGSGQLWALQMDVRDFFDSMDHGLLLDMVKRLVDEKPFIQLVSKMIKGKIFKEMGFLDHLTGSHQGSGLSPLLSNLYLHPLDRVMWSKFKDCYLRYSDDIAIFAREKEPLEVAAKLIASVLKELKLEVHAEKTTMSHASQGVLYLGFFMDAAGMGPAKKSVDQLLARLDSYDKVRKTDDIDEKLNEVTLVVRGWYNYYRTLTPIKPPNPLSAIAIARLLREMGQVQAAKQILKQSGDFKPTHPEISFQIGELYSSFGLSAQALREYAQALKLDPESEKIKEKIRALQEITPDTYKTIEQLQLLIHHNPHYREGYEKLVECYTELGLHGFAEKAHQKLLEIDDDPDSLKPLEPQTAYFTAENFPYQDVDIDVFMNLFQSRTDVHAKQWVDEKGRWGFMRIERGLKNKDIFKHLKGEETLAVFPVTVADTVFFIVFDVDTAKRAILESGESSLEDFRQKAHDDILRIKAACDSLGLFLYIEDSGYKGRHGWLFFQEDMPASDAIRLGREIMERAGQPSAGMVWELFPMGKSDRHKSQIKLPLGINRKNNRRCLFLNDDNLPIPDQALFVKTIRKSDRNSLNRIMAELTKTAEATEHPAADLPFEETLPDGLSRMVTGCKVLGHMISKARETNYLNHYERMFLLYTLGFAGDEGCGLLHKTIGYCINYDRGYTQRQIERRKESPMGCAKIQENFPELTRLLSCDCRFTLPPRGYPSPVLFLLQSELEHSQNSGLDAEKDAMAPEDKAVEPAEPIQEDPMTILDFDKIFSSEADIAVPETPDDEWPEPDAGDKDINADTPVELPVPEDLLETSESTPIKSSAESAEIPITEESSDDDDEQGRPEASVRQHDVKDGCDPMMESAAQRGGIPPFHADWNQAAPDSAVWELVMELMKLRSQEEKLKAEIHTVSAKIDALLSKNGADRIQSGFADIRKTVQATGKIQWVITIE